MDNQTTTKVGVPVAQKISLTVVMASALVAGGLFAISMIPPKYLKNKVINRQVQAPNGALLLKDVSWLKSVTTDIRANFTVRALSSGITDNDPILYTVQISGDPETDTDYAGDVIEQPAQAYLSFTTNHAAMNIAIADRKTDIKTLEPLTICVPAYDSNNLGKSEQPNGYPLINKVQAQASIDFPPPQQSAHSFYIDTKGNTYWDRNLTSRANKIDCDLVRMLALKSDYITAASVDGLINSDENLAIAMSRNGQTMGSWFNRPDLVERTENFVSYYDPYDDNRVSDSDKSARPLELVFFKAATSTNDIADLHLDEGTITITDDTGDHILCVPSIDAKPLVYGVSIYWLPTRLYYDTSATRVYADSIMEQQIPCGDTGSDSGGGAKDPGVQLQLE